MGYESRLYVVEKTGFNDYEGKTYAEVIAMFDLCKVYDVSDKMRRYKDTDVYFYGDNNARILADCYGSPLKEIPLKDAIRIIEEAIKLDRGYRRYEPCLNLLKGFNEGDWGDLVVLHYGY